MRLYPEDEKFKRRAIWLREEMFFRFDVSLDCFVNDALEEECGNPRYVMGTKDPRCQPLWTVDPDMLLKSDMDDGAFELRILGMVARARKERGHPASL